MATTLPEPSRGKRRLYVFLSEERDSLVDAQNLCFPPSESLSRRSPRTPRHICSHHLKAGMKQLRHDKGALVSGAYDYAYAALQDTSGFYRLVNPRKSLSELEKG